MPDIPRDVIQISDNMDEIPKEAAELAQDTEAPEMRPYFISFAKYNHKLCQIQILRKNKGKQALLILKDIGTKVFTRADFEKNKIQSKKINYVGGYKVLYNKIAQEIEIRELSLQGTGRIFYFDIEPERVLYIVAITENHLETDKVRR